MRSEWRNMVGDEVKLPLAHILLKDWQEDVTISIQESVIKRFIIFHMTHVYVCMLNIPKGKM